MAINKNVNEKNKQSVIDELTRRQVVNQNLDPSQQGILNADNQLSQTGRNLANSNLQGGNFGQSYTPQTMQRDYTGAVADRSRIEDEVFKKLTKGVEDQQNLS